MNYHEFYVKRSNDRFGLNKTIYHKKSPQSHPTLGLFFIC